MTRTLPRYALRGTTKAALLCAAIAAGLFVIAGGDLLPEESTGAAVQAHAKATSGSPISSGQFNPAPSAPTNNAAALQSGGLQIRGSHLRSPAEGMPAAAQVAAAPIAAPQIPESARTGALPIAPSPSAGAASYDCQRYSVKRGQWLQAVVMHRDHTGREWHECYYGSVQIRAGDANF